MKLQVVNIANKLQESGEFYTHFSLNINLKHLNIETNCGITRAYTEGPRLYTKLIKNSPNMYYFLFS